MKRALLLVLLLGGAAACADSMSSDPTGAYSESDPAFQLAVVDGVAVATNQGAEIEPYALTLGALDTKCTEDARTIGDYAVSARDQIAEAGVEAPSLLDILRDVNETIPTSQTGADCLSQFSAYVVLSVP